MTTVTDPDWIKIFGTDSSILEPPPEPPPKRRLKRHQAEAKFLRQHPLALRPDVAPQRTLFYHIPPTGDSD